MDPNYLDMFIVIKSYLWSKIDEMDIFRSAGSEFSISAHSYNFEILTLLSAGSKLSVVPDFIAGGNRQNPPFETFLPNLKLSFVLS